MENQKLKQTICTVKAYYIAAFHLDDVSDESLANYTADNYMWITLNAIDIMTITPFYNNLYAIEFIKDTYPPRIGLDIKYVIVSNKDVRKIKEILKQYYEY